VTSPAPPSAEPVRLAVWSGPRNISTALMRSWENREDTVVVDEPLYGHYLLATGLDHPGREEVIAAGETDWRRVVAALVGPAPGGARVFYQKHMAHHLLPGMDRRWVARLTNVLLIRDPREVVASYVRSRATVTVEDTGLPQQDRLHRELSPPVLDAADVLRRPERYLRALCDHAGVDFTPRMLAWPPGPRDSDGVWGRHWYDAVWRSTGFAEYRPRRPRLTAAAAEVAEECLPLYRRLHDARWVPH
jgi:Sulfotransferase domain